MSIVRFNEALGNSCATASKNAIDAGGAAATIKIYTGTIPDSPNTAISSQTLLGTLTCSYPCGAVVNKRLTFAAIAQDSAADATGTATWARTVASNDTAVMDIDVGATGSGAALQMNTTSIVTGGPIVISSLSLYFP